MQNEAAELIGGDRSYADYLELAQVLAMRHKAPLSLANESGQGPGRGIFKNKTLRRRLSFTPYVHNQCSAECVFCSERLLRKQSMPKKLRISEDYEDRLMKILEDLGEVSLFLSVSGMEPLESLPLVEKILAVFADYEKNGGSISERVIYTNLSQAAKRPEAVLRLLEQYPLSRIESSRHHYDTRINDSIMRFRAGQPIRDTRAYERAVLLLQKHIRIRLACVLQKRGVAGLEDLGQYLEWALSLGVRDISFRELALLGDEVTGGRSYRYILENRQSIFALLERLPSKFTLSSIVQGYYYFSFRYRYRDMANVTFSVSDYREMARRHESGAINKLIYYPDGSLCTDWNMLGRIY